MKNFIKNNIKVFVTLVISGIVFTGIGVYAASQYFAKDITFTPTNEKFKKENGEAITNVEDALNELYLNSNKENLIKNFKVNNSLSYEWVSTRINPKIYQKDNYLYFSSKNDIYGGGTIYYEIDDINKYSGFKIKIAGNGKGLAIGISDNVNNEYKFLTYDYTLVWSENLKDFNKDVTIDVSNIKDTKKYYLSIVLSHVDGIAIVEPIFK